MLHYHITAAFLLTNQNPPFTRAEVTYLLSKLNFPLPPPVGRTRTGNRSGPEKQLFSLTLPKDRTLEFRSNIWARCDRSPMNCKHDVDAVIENGVLKAGAIDKKAIAYEKGAVLDAIARNGTGCPRAPVPGRDEPARHHRNRAEGPLDVGIDDEDVPEGAQKEIRAALEGARVHVTEFVEQYRKGELEQMPGRSLEETLEVMVRLELGQARDTAGDIAGRYLGLENPAVILAKSVPGFDAQPDADGRGRRPAIRPGRAAPARLRPPYAPALPARRPRGRLPRVRQLELQTGSLPSYPRTLLPLDGRPRVAGRYGGLYEPLGLHAASVLSTPSRT